jgi:3-methyladenine DNA glycosylase Tag
MSGLEKIHPKNLADYLAVMSKSVFQTGISWRVVDAKWQGISAAFKGFDPQLVSRFTVRDIDRLVADTAVIRNRRKIEAIVENAHRMLELAGEHGSFQKYLRSFRSYEDLVKDLKKQFRFIGDTGAYYFLWVVGEKVPSWEQWNADMSATRPLKAAGITRHHSRVA